jgi:hypothetical protein
MHTEFWWGNLLENVDLEDRQGVVRIKVDVREILCENG